MHINSCPMGLIRFVVMIFIFSENKFTITKSQCYKTYKLQVILLLMTNNKEAEKREMDSKEERVRAITQLYYSNPAVIECLVEFARNREVVPRYYEGFG